MAALKPFRFGVVVPNAKTRGEWIARARLAEAMGYETFLVPDHFSDIAPVPALMAVANATSSIRIGSHVFGNDFRSPPVLARDVAALDMLSDGRFQLGLGCGFLLDDYQQAGIALDEPGTRVDRFQEALYIIKHYFTDDVVNFSGKYYTVTNLKGSTTHIQKPHPPIYMGGSGKRMIGFAGREADIVGINTGSSEMARRRLAWLREGAQERFDQLELAIVVYKVEITDEQKVVAQRIANSPQIMPWKPPSSITPEEVLDSLQMLIGTEEQIMETLLERRERFGFSYIQVLDKDLEAFAPIVARLAGK